MQPEYIPFYDPMSDCWRVLWRGDRYGVAFDAEYASEDSAQFAVRSYSLADEDGTEGAKRASRLMIEAAEE